MKLEARVQRDNEHSLESSELKYPEMYPKVH